MSNKTKIVEAAGGEYVRVDSQGRIINDKWRSIAQAVNHISAAAIWIALFFFVYKCHRG